MKNNTKILIGLGIAAVAIYIYTKNKKSVVKLANSPAIKDSTMPIVSNQKSVDYQYPTVY